MTRTEAISQLSDMRADYNCFSSEEPKYCALSMGIEALNEQKTGKWIKHPEFKEWDYCSACRVGCKRREYWIIDGRVCMTEESYRFCPNCGARMEVEDDNDVH